MARPPVAIATELCSNEVALGKSAGDLVLPAAQT
jgi:hypothetical protein